MSFELDCERKAFIRLQQISVQRIRREHEEQLTRKEELVNQYRYRPAVASDIAPKNEYAYPATLDMIKNVEPERPQFSTGTARSYNQERIVVGKNVSRSQTEYQFRLENSVRAREQLLSMAKTNDPLQTYRQSVFNEQLAKTMELSK